jgi:hypothetical protein
MHAEIEFDTPNPQVKLVFPGYDCTGLRPGTTLTISGLPLAFAQELRKRWNAWPAPEGMVME